MYSKLQTIEQSLKDLEGDAVKYGVKGQTALDANGGGRQRGGGKTLSLSAIQQAAKDHGVSVDEAKRQAVAAGYTIQ
jgi:hypothetical protein